MALPEDRFWSITPRELMALRSILDAEREELRHMYAAIQATLHNAWLRGKGKRAYKPEDFLGKKKKAQTWREQKDILAKLFTVASMNLPMVEAPPRAKGH